MTTAIARLQNASHFIVLGDSVAGGQRATGGNLVGGKGYARLLVTNHPDYPAYAGRDLSTQFPGIQFLDFSNDGSTFSLTRANLERAISMAMIPPFIQGDLVATIHAGTIDFFGNPMVLADFGMTRLVAANARRELAVMITILQRRYEKPGQAVIVLVDNLIDPTDGTGAIPDASRAAGCVAFHSVPVKAAPRQLLSNLDYLNREISAEVAARHAWLVNAHTVFLGHGMTADAGDRFIADDCHQVRDAGHDALRREAWKLLTGNSD